MANRYAAVWILSRVLLPAQNPVSERLESEPFRTKTSGELRDHSQTAIAEDVMICVPVGLSTSRAKHAPSARCSSGKTLSRVSPDELIVTNRSLLTLDMVAKRIEFIRTGTNEPNSRVRRPPEGIAIDVAALTNSGSGGVLWSECIRKLGPEFEGGDFGLAIDVLSD